MTNDLEMRIAAAVKKVLAENNEFSNVARPKATKASTATQGAWNIDDKPKASTATQGSWDATNTPGGVSWRTKEVWTKDQLVDAIAKAVMTNAQFYNRPIAGEAKQVANKVTSGNLVDTKKVSASTQVVWPKDPEDRKKLSASVCAQILTNVYKL